MNTPSSKCWSFVSARSPDNILFSVVAFVRYYLDVFRSVQATLPCGSDASVVAKQIGKMWGQLSDDVKQPYIDAHKAEVADRLRERDELLSSRPVSHDSLVHCVVAKCNLVAAVVVY